MDVQLTPELLKILMDPNFPQSPTAPAAMRTKHAHNELVEDVHRASSQSLQQHWTELKMDKTKSRGVEFTQHA